MVFLFIPGRLHCPVWRDLLATTCNSNWFCQSFLRFVYVCAGDFRRPRSGIVAVLVKKALSVRGMTSGVAVVIF